MPDGGERWFLKGVVHRVDGPASIWLDGTRSRFWYFNGKLHRTDGPAVQWWSGTEEWWLNNHQLNKKEIRRFKYLQTCPKKKLLEYIGTIYAPIIERRLRE